MAVESTSFINGLDPSLPTATDVQTEGDDHIRLVKGVLKNTLPNLSGPVTANSAALSNPILTTYGTANTLPFYNGASTATTIPFSTFMQNAVSSSNSVTFLTNIGAEARYVPQVGATTITGNTVVANSATISGATTSTGGLYVDANGGLALVSSNPTLYFDAGDYFSYNRSTNTLTFAVANSVTMTLTSAGNLSLVGDVTRTSDARLKTDVETMEDGLDAVMAFRPVRYRMMSDPHGSVSVGFLAQEVLDVMPEVVHQNEHGYYSLAYSNIVAPLVGAVQTLAREVNRLRLEVDMLKNGGA